MDDTLPAPAAEQLARMNRLATIARLVAGLAHELNNSLQIIGGTVELMTDRTDLPQDVLARLQRIGGQSEKATVTIRQVLGYCRETTSEAAALVDVGGTIRQVVALRQYPIHRAGITLKVDGLEGGPVPKVRADERTLAQAVLNLVVNAEEALVGQPAREIRIAVTPEGSGVRILVADSGPGVAPEHREQIFEPFFTTRSTERAVGLGLPVSRAIVERAGGRLTLADTSTGATFVIDLPVP
jgi:two-component system NtrC family sensor kinase